MTRSGVTVCLAASPGGHMAELQAGLEAFAGLDRGWVTGASSQADALRAAGEDVTTVSSWGRDPPGMRGLPSNARTSARLVRRLRPRLVVTTGAGLVVPFVLLARARGADVVFVESMARVRAPSLTGRIVSPFARTSVVQWPELRSGPYRHARVSRPALIEPTAGALPDRGEGTFVTVGTRSEPFDRLLTMVDRAVGAGVLPGPVRVQSGCSRYRSSALEQTPWMSPDAVAAEIRRARYVVCHGGAAVVCAAIAAGHRPLVRPRSRAAGEHRTEHQAELVERLARDDAVVRLGDEISAADVRAADRPLRPPPAAAAPSLAEVLGRELAELGIRRPRR